MNKPEDSMNSSFKTEENAQGNIPPLGDNLKMISQLANELYREDLTPEIVDQSITSKAEVKEQSSTAAYHSVDSAYYFLPDYVSSAYSKQTSNPYFYPDLDANSIRKDFPILQRRINGKALVWLDNAATTQKPICVINALNQYYSQYNSNIHRGAHTLAKLATNAYESAREKIRDFIGASSNEEVIFVRGTTEAINLVAESFGVANIQAGDEILLTMMEHHSNIVPWQKLQQLKGAVIKVAPINDRGEVILNELNSSIRASLGLYNTKEEIDCLASSVLKIAKYYN